MRCSLYTVDILRPCLHNRVLRAIIHHSSDCSEIHCPVPWCHFFSQRYQRLVWRSGNGFRHIDEVNLRRSQLVPEWVTTFGGATIRYLSSPTQPGHPFVGRYNEYRIWLRPSLGRNGASEVTTLWHFINQFINKNS